MSNDLSDRTDEELYEAWERELAQVVRDVDVSVVASLEVEAERRGVDLQKVLTAMTAAWDPSLHPRGKDGKFIEIGGLIKLIGYAVNGKDGKMKSFDGRRGKVMAINKDPKDPDNPVIRVGLLDASGKPSVILNDVKPKQVLQAPEKGRLDTSPVDLDEGDMRPGLAPNPDDVDTRPGLNTPYEEPGVNLAELSNNDLMRLYTSSLKGPDAFTPENDALRLEINDELGRRPAGRANGSEFIPDGTDPDFTLDDKDILPDDDIPEIDQDIDQPYITDENGVNWYLDEDDVSTPGMVTLWNDESESRTMKRSEFDALSDSGTWTPPDDEETATIDDVHYDMSTGEFISKYTGDPLDDDQMEALGLDTRDGPPPGMDTFDSGEGDMSSGPDWQQTGVTTPSYPEFTSNIRKFDPEGDRVAQFRTGNPWSSTGRDDYGKEASTHLTDEELDEVIALRQAQVDGTGPKGMSSAYDLKVLQDEKQRRIDGIAPESSPPPTTDEFDDEPDEMDAVEKFDMFENGDFDPNGYTDDVAADLLDTVNDALTRPSVYDQLGQVDSERLQEFADVLQDHINRNGDPELLNNPPSGGPKKPDWAVFAGNNKGTKVTNGATATYVENDQLPGVDFMWRDDEEGWVRREGQDRTPVTDKDMLWELNKQKDGPEAANKKFMDRQRAEAAEFDAEIANDRATMDSSFRMQQQGGIDAIMSEFNTDQFDGELFEAYASFEGALGQYRDTMTTGRVGEVNDAKADLVDAYFELQDTPEWDDLDPEVHDRLSELFEKNLFEGNLDDYSAPDLGDGGEGDAFFDDDGTFVPSKPGSSSDLGDGGEGESFVDDDGTFVPSTPAGTLDDRGRPPDPKDWTNDQLTSVAYDSDLSASDWERYRAALDERDRRHSEARDPAGFVPPDVAIGDVVRMPAGYLGAGQEVTLTEVTPRDDGSVLYRGLDKQGREAVWGLPATDRDLNRVDTLDVVSKGGGGGGGGGDANVPEPEPQAVPDAQVTGPDTGFEGSAVKLLDGGDATPGSKVTSVKDGKTYTIEGVYNNPKLGKDTYVRLRDEDGKLSYKSKRTLKSEGGGGGASTQDFGEGGEAAAPAANPKSPAPAGTDKRSDPKYKADYEKGWKYSGSKNANLDYADSKGLSSNDAWMDGYMDMANGEKKWASATKVEEAPAGATTVDSAKALFDSDEARLRRQTTASTGKVVPDRVVVDGIQSEYIFEKKGGTWQLVSNRTFGNSDTISGDTHVTDPDMIARLDATNGGKPTPGGGGDLDSRVANAKNIDAVLTEADNVLSDFDPKLWNGLVKDLEDAGIDADEMQGTPEQIQTVKEITSKWLKQSDAAPKKPLKITNLKNSDSSKLRSQGLKQGDRVKISGKFKSGNELTGEIIGSRSISSPVKNFDEGTMATELVLRLDDGRDVRVKIRQLNSIEQLAAAAPKSNVVSQINEDYKKAATPAAPGGSSLADLNKQLAAIDKELGGKWGDQYGNMGPGAAMRLKNLQNDRKKVRDQISALEAQEAAKKKPSKSSGPKSLKDPDIVKLIQQTDTGLWEDAAEYGDGAPTYDTMGILNVRIDQVADEIAYARKHGDNYIVLKPPSGTETSIPLEVAEAFAAASNIQIPANPSF